MTILSLSSAATSAGALMLSRLEWGPRFVGLGLCAIGFGLVPAPAFADQVVEAGDNARIDCTVAAQELTRVSLVDDQFASVSKTEAGDPRDDFSVVNEPTRGDIYISVPAGFRPKALSFFGTSKKGFVYKFACKVEKTEAQQIFVANHAAQQKVEASAPPADSDEAPDNDEVAVRLIQGMAGQKAVPGFHMTRSALAPVKSGSLSVQLIAEYKGLDLTGRVIRIENLSEKAVDLSEGAIAPAGAVAVNISTTKLAPHAATGAYVVMAGAR